MGRKIKTAVGWICFIYQGAFGRMFSMVLHLSFLLFFYLNILSGLPNSVVSSLLEYLVFETNNGPKKASESIHFSHKYPTTTFIYIMFFNIWQIWQRLPYKYMGFYATGWRRGVEYNQ